MDEFRIFTYALPGSDEKFCERLSLLSDSINKQKAVKTPWISSLGQSAVQQIAVASSHVAILLEDGRICRIAYSLNTERLESNRGDDKNNLWSATAAKKPKKKSTRVMGGGGGGGGGAGLGDRVHPYRRNVTSATIGSGSGGSGGGGGSLSAGGVSARSGRPNYRNLFMSSVPFIPPSQVPDDLIVQVQNVLQGKSRSLIIRELQRTNLDVNSAVNNLLSRDDEDGDEDEVGDLFADDLMSFVENNLSERAGNYILESDQMLVEDYLNYATAYRTSSAASVGRHRLSLRNEILRSGGNPISNLSAAAGGAAHTFAGSAAGNLGNSGTSGSGNNGGSQAATGSSSFDYGLHGLSSWESVPGGMNKTSKVKSSSNSSDPIIWEEPEWFILLPDAMSSPPPKFVQIAAMHSELVALSKAGQVYQWKWNVSMPFVHPDIADVHHPRIAHLDLQNEVIVCLAASSLRCSVLTQSGRVATWMDPVVASYCSKLEHGAIPLHNNFAQSVPKTFSSAGGMSKATALNQAANSCADDQSIKELKVCDLFTVAVTQSGKLFWWGVAPFGERRKVLEKQAASKSGTNSNSNNARCRHSNANSSDGQLAITEGCTVTKKKSPMYHAGAIGFCDCSFPPKVGQLMEDIWNLDASCRFKILPMEKKRRDECKKTEMLPPPSPVSVGSEGSHKSTSRKRRRSVSPHPYAAVEEEVEQFQYWNPKNVVFLEDSQNIPIGTVLKVDGNIAAVKFPSVACNNEKAVVVVVPANSSSDNSNQSMSEDQALSNIWKDCRLFHKSDLQALKPNSLPKFLDCIQTHPKPIPNQTNSEKFHVLAVAVDSKGVHVVSTVSQYKFCYCVIEPSSGRIEERRMFFSDLPAFIGLNNPIKLQVAPEEPGRLLLDGNECLYPLCKDDAGQMRDPATLNMLPIKAAAMGVHHVPGGASGGVGTSSVHRVLITALVTKPCATMSAVLQCNQQQLEMRLAEYELNPEREGPVIVNERCDANRNVIHALVHIGRPVSNNSQSSSASQTKNKEDSTRHSVARSGQDQSQVSTPVASDQQQQPSDTSSSRPVIGASQFDQDTNAITSTSASLTAATNAIQNGAEILRRLREEVNAATEAARRQLAVVPSSGASFDAQNNSGAIPTIAWPPDPPAYENIPLSAGSLLDISSSISLAAPASRSSQPSVAPMLTSNLTQTMSSTARSNPAEDHSRSRDVDPVDQPAAATVKHSSEEERQQTALKMLITLLTFRRANFEKRLQELLAHQDAAGMTPFMLAVNLRAYNMALLIFNAAKRLAALNSHNQQIDQTALMKMVFPAAVSVAQLKSMCVQQSWNRHQTHHQQQMHKKDDADLSPLYMLCCNDNCSFTWTGNLHINQDIFECRTCGLHDTYCCCTECAKNCHKGHDCKLKKIWPTAYCDCWRRGRCCALIEGDQKARFELLCELLQHTNLASLPNKKGEHLLLSLVNTISRQMLEQGGLSKNSVPNPPAGVMGSAGNVHKSGSNRHNAHSHAVESSESLEGMPDHNLEPPKFCRIALCQTVVNWKAVSSLMLQSVDSVSGDSGSSSQCASFYEEDTSLSPLQAAYLKSQSGSSKLDSFTYKLVKSKNETGFRALEKLCETLLAQMQRRGGGAGGKGKKKKPQCNEETLLVVRRFVRSVCRVFVVLSMETQNSKNKAISSEPIRKCKTVFRMLMPVAIEELVETADCLLAPVRMGVARPTRPFASLASSAAADEKQASAELFSMEPLPPRRVVSTATTGNNPDDNGTVSGASRSDGNAGPGGSASAPMSRGERRRRLDDALNASASRIDSRVELDTSGEVRTLIDVTSNQHAPRSSQMGGSTSGGSGIGGTGPHNLGGFNDSGGATEGGESSGPQGGSDANGRIRHLDFEYTAIPGLGDHFEMDDDGHGSSADGGVGEEDVTFEVDMMDEESDGGVENSEEEDEEEDDDDEDDDDEDEEEDEDDEDDLDAPMGGEEQQHLIHVEQSNNANSANNDNNRASAVVAQQQNAASSLDALSSPIIGARSRNAPDEIRDPLSPQIGSSRADFYFSSTALGDHRPTDVGSGSRGDRGIIIAGAGVEGPADRTGALSDGEESRSSSQDDESEVGADDHHRAENDMVDDLYLTESTLDAENLGSGAHNSYHHSSNRNVPIGTQWAVGGQPVATAAAAAVPAAPARAGMIYVDPSTIRRGGVASAAHAAAAAAGGALSAVNIGTGGASFGASAGSAMDLFCSSTATNISLARAFSLVVRSVTELIFLAAEEESEGTSDSYLNQQQVQALQDYVDKRLHITWQWLSTVLDSTEAQLRFGAALISSTDASHPMHPLNSSNSNRRPGSNNQSSSSNQNNGNTSSSSDAPNSRRAFDGRVSGSSRAAQQDSSAARKDFLGYILSLMRAHSGEHGDALPVIDISAFKHVAYVLDAMVYYLRHGKEAISKSQDAELEGPASVDMDASAYSTEVQFELGDYDNEDDSLDEAIFVGLTTGSNSVDDFSAADGFCSRKSGNGNGGFSFFRRSNSTLCLGATSPDPFKHSYAETLPLAERPQLLTPHATKEEMFGAARFDEVFALTKQSKSKSKADTTNGEATVVSVSTSEIQVLPLALGMDERVESNWEQLLMEDTARNTDSDGENMDTDSQAADYNSFFRVENQNSADKDNADEDEDADNEGALDMSSTTLNAVEAQQRQQELQIGGNSSEASTSSQGPVSIRCSTPNKNESKNESEDDNDVTYTLTNVGSCRVAKVVETNFSRDMLLGRWAHSLELFGRVFIDDVGAQPGSLLAEISSFDVREARFKKEMERIRNSQTRDLALEVERERNQLILQTMKQLNSQYSKRSSYPGQPLAVHKVKVTFKNEPGEGTGVSRSFYTAIAEVLLADERLPKLDSLSGTNNAAPQMSRIRKVRTCAPVPVPTSTPAIQTSSANSLEAFTRAASTAAAMILGSSARSRGYSGNASQLTAALNVNAAPYVPPSASSATSNTESKDDSLAAAVYSSALALQPQHAAKITGMLMELETQQLLQLKSHPDSFREKVDEALALILSCAPLTQTPKVSSGVLGDAAAPDEDESAPLFYQPGKTGFYSPRLGKCTKERLDVFRNVGRLIGLCLLQNELIPLPFNRHVLKYILHKELSWHDFAFFDPVTYESMRKLVLESMGSSCSSSEEMFRELCLTYSVVLCKEEGGGQVDLVPNGSQHEVTPKNVLDFVRRYCEYRMRTCMEKPLRAIRRGVYEVVPPSALSDLTAEDLRLLLNGTWTVDPKQLMSFTNFIDETGGDDPEKIRKFKRSFWTVVHKMRQKELQDLMYFWTGSPSVPASEEGFQPMPSITLRPADDNYFPSANTCISRLYIPLYSSKTQLKLKLLQAIQVKSFGFV